MIPAPNGTAGENKTAVRGPLQTSKLSHLNSTPAFSAPLDPCLLWVHRTAGAEHHQPRVNSGRRTTL
jgi:hypothetical protein